MKKLTTILCLVFLSFTAKAQINLEHSFTNEVGSVTPFNANNTTYFCVLNSTDQLKIFNSDYSLYKSVALPIPSGYYAFQIMLISSKLFNTDDKIEFLVSSMLISNNSSGPLILFNENGEFLKDFGVRYYAQAFKTASNQTILCVYSWSPNCITEIYSLPGTLPNEINLQNAEDLKPPFPNPSNTIIILPYNLENCQTSTMSIFNSNGQLIEQKQIDSVFDKILLNVESYQHGVYVYEYNGISNRFIVN